MFYTVSSLNILNSRKPELTSRNFECTCMAISTFLVMTGSQKVSLLVIRTQHRSYFVCQTSFISIVLNNVISSEFPVETYLTSLQSALLLISALPKHRYLRWITVMNHSLYNVCSHLTSAFFIPNPGFSTQTVNTIPFTSIFATLACAVSQMISVLNQRLTHFLLLFRETCNCSY